MANLELKAKNPAKYAAIQLFALNHSITLQQVADKVGVSKRIVRHWREDPEFHAEIYNCYMQKYDSKIPEVLDAMFEEACAGNVQAARLVLEQGGKLVKNVVNISVSPYEMFLNKVVTSDDDKDIIEAAVESNSIDIDYEEIKEQGKKREDSQKKRTRYENKKIKTIEDKAKYNEKQREWYKWRKRAEKAGVEPLEGRRPTPAQRKAWEEKIIKAENKE